MRKLKRIVVAPGGLVGIHETYVATRPRVPTSSKKRFSLSFVPGMKQEAGKANKLRDYTKFDSTVDERRDG